MRVTLVDFIGSAEAWGTEKGAEVFGALNKELLNVSQGIVVSISYRGLQRSDASFQREAVVELLRKYRPRLCFVATELKDKDVLANLELALQRYQLCLLLNDRGSLRILGKQPNKELSDTWRFVEKAGRVTTPRLADALDLETATASSRLSTLWKAGLLKRTEGAASTGGREFLYEPLLS